MILAESIAYRAELLQALSRKRINPHHHPLAPAL
jgi:hypothetical protein